ncbi:glucosamine-6-phosphate deaminase [Paenilisteria rocourtiae]|uniref:Glucosamine-6-phosphate deaminase n=1 Tax=Listeria rocourtiae TaxID=647910 RepID=A0A4R6ZFD9_9LIST|nr:glucosamine-6-phosphate deaminase [Listeria rocourtiae]EUJ47513.1 glucosamine-6-phosphate deaminase [Listeria rocourtiae FSL F6-920]MBC1605263.1 glucosamine-6-phosphate deaminase [Listeria rocourtiae]TDR50921.1 glucosamine-6-phosphate deaminase [Listeria rocourtiae]
MNALNLTVLADYEMMSDAATDLVIGTLKKAPEGLYCFAGGDTPVGTLRRLVAAHKNGEIDLQKAYFVELDEWVGLDGADKGSCLNYLETELFGPAEIDAAHYHYFQAKSVDLEGECQAANEFIEMHGGLELILLGVGVNGHLGFNEPGVSFENYAHLIDLDSTTQDVGQKYFTKEVDRTKGITLGIKHILEAKTAILVANGEKKQAAITHLLEEKVTDNWPVTILRKHENAHIFIDENAFA